MLEVMKGKLEAWEGALMSKGLRVNDKRTKIIINGENAGKTTEKGKFPCAVSRKGGGSNSILYQFRRCWVHKGCSIIRGKLKEGTIKVKC